MNMKTENQLFQHSTMAALVGGLFDGTMTFSELLKHGDLGIGTFDQFDGELVVADGKAYQVREDGKAYEVAPEATTPYASVTHFAPDTRFKVTEATTREQIEARTASLTQGPNLFYAVQIQGKFRFVNTRVAPKQTKPYPPLVEAVKTQPTYHFEEIEGTIVGFYMPAYITGIGVSGYHIHFIDQDKQVGGHVFDYELLEGTVEIAEQTAVHLELPHSKDFLNKNLASEDMLEQIDAAEK
ncbi:acetolactate decarboxylase [Listeria aquatica]|uniref:Alpha-acetolactate decarboxylase n=1 Tax=Listeria aquatica TaxID=1494960 RepID=A0A841ZLT0_9LIST|nr:acetolactate decarboxylase [Listeria aquatica]